MRLPMKSFALFLLVSSTAAFAQGPRALDQASNSDANGLVKQANPSLRLDNNVFPIAVAHEQDIVDINRARVLAGKPLLREDDLARRSVQEACLQKGFAWAASWRTALSAPARDGVRVAAAAGDLLPGLRLRSSVRENTTEGDLVRSIYWDPVYFVTAIACTNNRELVGSRMAWEFLDAKETAWDTQKLQKKYKYVRSAGAAAPAVSRNFEARCWAGLCEGDQVWLPLEDQNYGSGVVDRIDFDKDEAQVRFEKKPGQLVSVALKKLEKR